MGEEEKSHLSKIHNVLTILRWRQETVIENVWDTKAPKEADF